jgi:shikimate 5-dehydrogenase
MKKFGLIGHPIAHSLSPALFKAAYDGKYAYDLIEGEDFETSYRRFAEEYNAINVTAPFKGPAFSKADILSEECKVTGATNLLVKTPEGIKAYNSDFLGVRMWLSEVAEDMKGVLPPWPQGSRANSKQPGGLLQRAAPTEWAGFLSYPQLPLKGVKILIVGLGGAGKAAAAAAESLGMEVIRMNRTVRDSTTHPLDEFRQYFREADIIIYNIPTAIPELKELTESDFAADRPKHILEANYKDPSMAEILKPFGSKAVYTGGRTWLLYQAVTGYEILTGEKPDLRRMSDVL